MDTLLLYWIFMRQNSNTIYCKTLQTNFVITIAVGQKNIRVVYFPPCIHYELCYFEAMEYPGIDQTIVYHNFRQM